MYIFETGYFFLPFRACVCVRICMCDLISSIKKDLCNTWDIRGSINKHFSFGPKNYIKVFFVFFCSKLQTCCLTGFCVFCSEHNSTYRHNNCKYFQLVVVPFCLCKTKRYPIILRGVCAVGIYLILFRCFYILLLLLPPDQNEIVGQ